LYLEKGARFLAAFAGMAQVSSSLIQEVCSALAAARRENSHWCCDDDFMKITGLEHETMVRIVAKWCGKESIWLDLVATAVACGVGSKVNVGSVLGAQWKKDADLWIDQAYAAATEKQRRVALQYVLGKTRELVESSLRHLGIPTKPATEKYTKINVRKRSVIACEKCGEPFSERLGQCPSCFPREGPVAKDSSSDMPMEKWRTLPAAPLDGDLQWTKASEVVWCHGGSGGAFLFKLPEGAVCVKKANMNLRAELFAQYLADALNVRTARMRVTWSDGQEHNNILNVLQESLPYTIKSKGTFAEAYEIVEFVDGCMMMGIPAHEHLSKMTNATVVWHGLGRLMGLDLLINNFDRLPLAWSNAGNLGNVMLGACSNPIIGIDQCANCITHDAGLRAYKAAVQKAVGEAKTAPGPAFGAVSKSIYENTAVQIMDAELSHIREGCLEFVTEIADLLQSGALEAKLDAVSLKVASSVRDCNQQSAPNPAIVRLCELVKDIAHAMREELWRSESLADQQSSSPMHD